MLVSVYEYDGVPFERIDGKWICKGIAMRGPSGSMLDKEVPEIYAKPIEQAYQALIANKNNPGIKLIGRRNSESDEIQEIDPMEKKIEQLKKKLEHKENKQISQKIERAQEKVKKKMPGGISLFGK